ncbi:MAG: hypothetical protein HC780_23240 [Leptolyngbyaceae cyanobacterium CSU_1_3]|nr:hypothetical protein [Leptolyngbyaceae cyanobacterium CSU_1_3]
MTQADSHDRLVAKLTILKISSQYFQIAQPRAHDADSLSLHGQSFLQAKRGSFIRRGCHSELMP